MANSSRFIQLSSSILMEYIYSDTDNITTSAAPWYKMVNGYDEKEYYFNDDNSASQTGNVRDRSAAIIDTTLNKFAYLNIDEIVAYNDIDSNLTNTVDLPVTFLASDPVYYDTIRLHLIQGFNFEQNEGLLFEVEFNRPDDVISKMASLVYLKEDDYEELNPNPFLFNGRSYTSYIELKIPSLKKLIEEYQTEFVVGGDTDILSYKISGGNGFRSRDSINFRFGFIDTKERFNGNSFFYVTSQNEFSLPKEDQYSSLSAQVIPSTGGDYIEIYGEYNGLIYEDFVNGLNNSGGDYIAQHQIVVSEQVGMTWIETQVTEIQQTSGFDDPIKFRPIIENNNAVAYRIEYTLKLLNRNDNQTIVKVGSYTSTDVSKYGRSLSKINLGSNPIVTKVYNKVYDNVVNFTKSGASAIPKPELYKKYVTSFFDISNLVLNSENVFFDVDGNIVSSSQGKNIAYGQGLAEIVIAPFDSYHKMVISEKSNSALLGKDLSGVGTVCLNFKDSKGFTICIEEEVTNQINKALGEVLFKISTNRAGEINGLSDKTFYITSRNEDGLETLIYTGEFISSSDFPTLSKISEINKLKEELILIETDITEIEGLLNTTEDASDYVFDNFSALNSELKDNPSQQNLDLRSIIENRFKDEVDSGIASIKTLVDDLKNKLNDLNK